MDFVNIVLNHPIHRLKLVQDDLNGQASTGRQAPVKISLRRIVTLIIITALTLVGPFTLNANATTQFTKPTALSSLETQYMKILAKRIVADVTELDIQVQDGILVNLRLEIMANNFDRLADLPAPPKAKTANYKSRAKTLANFSRLAAEEYSSENEMAGSARYQVIRKQTAPLLVMINKGLKTKFRLPELTGPASTPAAGGLSTAQAESVKKYAGRVVEDITELDIRVQDGIVMDSRLLMLARSYRSLADGAVPPNANPSDYYSLASTLASFAEQAAGEYSQGQSLSGSARYSVIRAQTIPLLTMINNGLNTNYVLP